VAVKYTKLPDTLFTVKVPTIYTYSEAEMNSMGLPMRQSVDGRDTVDAQEISRVMLPLTRIIDIYSNGGKISLVNPDEVTTIYKILEDYLRDYNPITPELNSTSYDESRDIDIDRFASEMFDLNRRDIVSNTINKKSGFDIGIHKMGIGRINRNNASINSRRPSVTEAYMDQNPLNSNNTSISDVYITHNDSIVDPDKVVRKSVVKRRKRMKPGDAK